MTEFYNYYYITNTVEHLLPLQELFTTIMALML